MRWPRFVVCSALLFVGLPAAASAQNPVDAMRLHLGPRATAITFLTGSGTPEGAITAPVKSQYYDWTTGEKWRKASGVGNVGWIKESGTVTSVTITVPSPWSASGCTITTSGTCTITLATQAANALFAGPTAGVAATPAFRALVLADVPDDLLTNAKVNAAAAIAWSKISKTGSSLADFTTRSAGDLSSGTLPDARMPALTGDITTSAGAVATAIAAGVIVNADVNAGAAIVYSKLNLSASLVNADVATGAAIAYAKLALTGSIVDADIVSVTTRAKLPSALAYEDEVNTFTQATTLSGRVAGHLLPTVADTYDVGSYDYPWREANVSQINAVVFAEATQTLFGGYSTIGHDAGTLGAAVSSVATTVDFGETMTPGDFILIRAQDTGGTYTHEYMTVGILSAGTTYNVTRNLSGAGAKNWADSLPFLVLGQSGDGRIDLLAYDGRPRAVFLTQGATYNAQDHRAVIGNLNGYYGYATDVYGAAFGVTSGVRVLVDATNGIRMYDGANIARVTITPAGTATFSGDGGSVTNINGGNIQTDTITATQIAANAITTTELNADSVTSEKIVARTIVALDITVGAITANELNFTPATSTNVIATINASAEGLDITADRISISGTTTFSAGYDPTGKIAAAGAAADINANVTTISGGKITANTITADRMSVTNLSAIAANLGTITAASMALGSNGYVRQGQTAYDTGTGFWIGDVSGTPKLSIGSASVFLKWSGTELLLDTGPVTINANGIKVAPATDVAGEAGCFNFNTGTSWGMCGVAGDGPISTTISVANSTNTAFGHATLTLLAQKTHASAVATVSITGGVITLTGTTSVTGTLAVSSTMTGGTYNGQTISSAANFTGTLAVSGAVTGTTYNGQTISSAANLTGSLTVAGRVTVNTSTDGPLILNYTGAGDPNTSVAFYRSGVVQGSITTTAGSTAYNTASDARLKTHWRSPSYSLATLMQVKIRDFDWIASGAPGTGVSAQQLDRVFPWAVTRGETWQVDYGKLTPLLVVSMQQLKAELDALRAEVRILKEVRK